MERKAGILIRELLVRYRTDYQDRAALLNTASLIFNALIGIGKLILGLYLLSGWFIINALYYLVLSAARGQALHKYAVAASIEEPAQRYEVEFLVYKRSGIFIALLGVSYLLVCLRMYYVGDTVTYSGPVVFLVAAVAFSKLGFSIHGIMANRHLKGPIVSTLKLIGFTDAMVSIVVTQYTLLAMQASPHALSSSALFGMGCSILFILIGVYMVFRKKKPPLPQTAPVQKKKRSHWLLFYNASILWLKAGYRFILNKAFKPAVSDFRRVTSPFMQRWCKKTRK